MVDFTMYSGDSRTLTVLIHDHTGALVDVTDAQAITYAIVQADGEIAATKTLADGIAVAGSTVTVALAPADTAELTAGTYIHELEVITAESHVYTVLQGQITIQRDYIHHAP